MHYQWKLPDVGEGIHEAEIIRLLIREGDQVEADQVILEIQTDKALVEIPSPVKGKVVKINVTEREIIRVGTVVVEFETQTAGKAPEAATSFIQPTGSAPRSGRVLATPAMRKLARELGVEIQKVTGTGSGGRVTEEDVRTAQSTAQSPATGNGTKTKPAVSPSARQPHAEGRVSVDNLEERIPLQGLRRVISERMARSKFTAPHATGMDEADVTELVSIRKKAAAIVEAKGIKLTYLPFVIKAIVSALKEYPYFNASLDDEKGEIVLKRCYNIGIAVDTPDGLLVPVVKDADKKSLLELAAQITRLTEKAMKRTLDLSDLQGGTFTISNIGSFDGYFATPIINYPEVAILATGKIAKKPVMLDDDSIVGRYLMPVSLTFDHRIIDGGMSGRFTKHIIRYLQDPTLMFMEMI